MKKILFAVAMFAVAASCSKTESVDVVGTKQNPIEFETLRYVPTKAANDDSDNYKVYAQYTDASKLSAWFIDGHDYTSSNAPTPVAYYVWPSDGTLDFYAYSPAGSTSIAPTVVEPESTTPTKGSVSLAYTVPASADEDFTVATPVAGLSEGTVALTFNHMLSKVLFEVRLSDDLIGGVAGTSVADMFEFGTGNSPVMNFGVKRNSGAVTLNGDAPVFVVGGTDASPLHSYTGIGQTTDVGSGVDGNYSVSFNIAPQVSEGSTIDISGIVINNKATGLQHFAGSLSTFTLAAGMIDNTLAHQTSANHFEQGNAYKFIVEIGWSSTSPEPGDPDPTPDPIFNIISVSSSVVDWEDVSINLEEIIE